MIADARFGASDGRVRRLRFVRRASIALDAACAVANGIRELLRELFGADCELLIGEPAALDAHAWSQLAQDALLFLSRGRRTDVVLVLPRKDARRLVLRAFGEPDANAPLPEAACSALELHALERIAARCAAACDPLGAEACERTRAVAATDLPRCSAYFDVRVRAPVGLTLGIGIVRDLPDPAPARMLAPDALDSVAVEARAVFAEGTLDAAGFVKISPGAIVKLDTKVGAPASLNLGDMRLAVGVPGVVASRTAFLVRDLASGAVPT